jgi:hypothetical protein
MFHLSGFVVLALECPRSLTVSKEMDHSRGNIINHASSYSFAGIFQDILLTENPAKPPSPSVKLALLIFIRSLGACNYLGLPLPSADLSGLATPSCWTHSSPTWVLFAQTVWLLDVLASAFKPEGKRWARFPRSGTIVPVMASSQWHKREGLCNLLSVSDLTSFNAS